MPERNAERTAVGIASASRQACQPLAGGKRSATPGRRRDNEPHPARGASDVRDVLRASIAGACTPAGVQGSTVLRNPAVRCATAG